jgi:hypothetical protein
MLPMALCPIGQVLILNQEINDNLRKLMAVIVARQYSSSSDCHRREPILCCFMDMMMWELAGA